MKNVLLVMDNEGFDICEKNKQMKRLCRVSNRERPINVVEKIFKIMDIETDAKWYTEVNKILSKHY